MSIIKLSTAFLAVPATLLVITGTASATNQSNHSSDKHANHEQKDTEKDNKDCDKEEPKVPAYSCKLLTVTLGVDRSVSAKVDVVAENGATLNSISYDFGDGTAPVVTNGAAASHTYAKDGTYKVVATVTFNVGKALKTSTCAVDVTIKLPPPTQVLPATTTTLPNTGVGSVAGLFAGATGLSAVGHAVVSRRKNR